MMEIIDEIKEIMNRINDMPYGVKGAKGNMLPANPYHFSICVDKLINSLIDLGNKYGNVKLYEIEKVRSLRDNDVNKLITDYNNYKKKKLSIVNYDMEKVSSRIKCIVECILKSNKNKEDP